jgi:hypothetical protein
VPDLDLAKLREIAEKARQQAVVNTVAPSSPPRSAPWIKFHATFNPATVLALLDEIDRLKEIIKADVWKLPVTPEIIDTDLEDLHGTIPHSRVYRLIAEVKSLRARIEELEKGNGAL